MDDDVTAIFRGEVSQRLGFVLRVAAVEKQAYGAAEPYSNVFRGLGQVKDVIYRLKFKSDAQRAVKPARHVVVTLQEKVEAELERNEANQVIEKLTESTKLLSYVVVVVEKDKVRVYLDTSDLNKPLLRK